MRIEPGLRILVVDDDELTRRVTCLQLEASGHLAFPISTTTALSAEQEGRWDVILADICLPDESGMALVGHLIARFPSAYVIVLTAHWTTADTTREAMRRGAWDSLIKPFQFGDLLAILAELPGGRRAGCGP